MYEGERMKSDANNLLGQFTITGIERAKKGEAKVDVTFSLDSNGILNVEAQDQKTKAHAKITIANRGRSSDADIDRMVKDAEKFRREDEARLKKVEATNELEGLILEVQNLMVEDPTLSGVGGLEETLHETAEWLESNRTSAAPADVAAKKRALSTALTRAQRDAAGVARPGQRAKARN